MIIFLTSRREMSCSVTAPSSHPLSSLPVARPQWAIHSIPFGGRTAFQHYTAVPACRRRRNVMPGAWRRASQWIMRDFTPRARQAARAPKMWHGDARPKAARCKCGKDHPDIARTCCCPTSKAMAWHLPVAAKAVIGACSLVGNAARRARLQNRRKFVRCSAPAAPTETPRFRSRFYELYVSQRNYGALYARYTLMSQKFSGLATTLSSKRRVLATMRRYPAQPGRGRKEAETCSFMNVGRSSPPALSPLPRTAHTAAT